MLRDTDVLTSFPAHKCCQLVDHLCSSHQLISGECEGSAPLSAPASLTTIHGSAHSVVCSRCWGRRRAPAAWPPPTGHRVGRGGRTGRCCAARSLRFERKKVLSANPPPSPQSPHLQLVGRAPFVPATTGQQHKPFLPFLANGQNASVTNILQLYPSTVPPKLKLSVCVCICMRVCVSVCVRVCVRAYSCTKKLLQVFNSFSTYNLHCVK